MIEQLIVVIAKALVDHPEDVRAFREEDDRNVTYNLVVHPDDVGKVIGRGGRIAKAMRTVVLAQVPRSSKRVNIEIVS